MICRLPAVKVIFRLMCFAVIVGGCTSKNPRDYKQQADQTVYNIIDQKWQDDFGSKTNYKISDVEPSPDSVQIKKEVPASGVLTLAHAVSLATAQNRQYQLEKEALYLKALDLRLARHEFEPWLFGTADAGYIKSDGRQGISSTANLGFQKLLAGGARISTNVTLAWVEVLTGNVQGGLASIFSATVTQPLLRGSDRKIILENLTQAERDTLYQIRMFNRFRKTFIVSVISQYYQVLQQYDNAKNAYNNYKTLFAVHQRAVKLANAGRIPQFELDQARQDKLKAWDNYVQAKELYKRLLDEFKITVSLQPSTKLQLDADELEALAAVPMTKPNFSEVEAIETALEQRLDLANSEEAIEDAERKVAVAADNLRTQLNLTAGTQLTTKKVSDPLDLRGTVRNTGAAGLELDLDPDKLLEENEYRKALITLSQRKREFEQAADTVQLEIRQAYRDLIESIEHRQIQLNSLELAKKRFDNTLQLLQYGRANTRDVLDAQKDLYGAQNAATEALVNYTIATLNFYRDTGVLQVRPDGMWEH